VAAAEQRARQEAEDRARHDPFAEFQEQDDESTNILRLMPLAMWARVESKGPKTEDDSTVDDLHELIAGLSIPAHVATITYPRGCRIRRVRVRAVDRPRPSGSNRQPVIVSRRALEENRSADR
jgi:hypothetical protein